MNCKTTEPSTSMVTSSYFIKQAIDMIKSKKLKAIFERYKNLPNLTYRDAVVLIAQIMPKYVYNNWPGVGIEPPLDIPTLQPFNNNFNIEWYYYNVNGFVTNTSNNNKKQRFYMLRVVKRIGIKYQHGLENTPWLFSDVISLFIQDEQKILIHTCGPCFSGAIKNVPTKDSYFSIDTNPLNIDYIVNNETKFNAFHLENGGMKSIYSGNSLSFDNITSQNVDIELNCVCDKEILLQGPQLNGLDPSADNFISKLSGASYLYYSWPSWKLTSGNFTINNTKYTIDSTPYQLWLDHQGGTVKAPESIIMSQFAIFAGARPLIFPGWNWFSIQLDDNTQFTGYSNKPWNNNKEDNKHYIKGTWSDSKGNLEWIYGISTIEEWWQSPDSGVNFGTKYSFDLGKKGVYMLKAIIKDQRAPHEGLEQYEGGCDVYKDNKQVGVGNIECVGWPDLKQRIDFASKTLTSPFTDKEKDILYTNLQTRTLDLVVLLIIITLVLTFALSFVLKRVFEKNFVEYKFTNNIFFIIFVALMLIIFIIFIFCLIFRKILCSVSKTCSVGFRAGCLFNCVS